MITRQVVSFGELIKDTGFWDTVCGMVHDECGLTDVLRDLCKSELHQAYFDGENIGFLTVDRHSSDVIEVHAFINPDSRKHSLAALREIDRAHPESILTSVWGTHPHACIIAKRMGFKHCHTEVNDIIKGGVAYDMDYFYKEKSNGR